MADFFASSYGWTDDYIMNCVPLDRYFIRKEIIEKRERQEHMQKIQIAMIPQMDNDKRNKLIKDLEAQDREPLAIGKGTETDFEALKRAKEQQNKGI